MTDKNPQGDVWLVRHGSTAWSASGRHTGRTDLPLSADGAAEAMAVGNRLRHRPFALVLTSPLQRATETCRLAGFGDVARTELNLVEWDYGAYEGRRSSEILAERPGWSLFDDGCPGGETAADVGARVDRVIARLRSTPGDSLVFAHGHLLRVLGARWVGLSPDLARIMALAPATLSELGWEHGRPILVRWNDAEGTPTSERLTAKA